MSEKNLEVLEEECAAARRVLDAAQDQYNWAGPPDRPGYDEARAAVQKAYHEHFRIEGLWLKAADSRVKGGFTLVELMLVIAIMVILLALFLPILFGARDRARSVTCLSNLRQMGLAMQMYVQDHDDAYPIGAYQNNGVSVKGSWDTSWHDGLMPYFQNRVDAFLCPSTTGPRFYRRSYGVNPWICAYRGGITAAMVEGSPRVLVAEKATGDWPVYPRSYFDGPSHLYLTEPHTGRLHVLYTDGRVVTTTAFELASVVSSWAPKP